MGLRVTVLSLLASFSPKSKSLHISKFGRKSMSIYVGNLSYDVTQDDLSEVFAEYGTVKRVQLPTDRETGRPRGFGFVEVSSENEEQKAIEALDGAEWMGRDIKAKPREDRGSGGNRRNSPNYSRGGKFQ